MKDSVKHNYYKKRKRPSVFARMLAMLRARNRWIKVDPDGTRRFPKTWKEAFSLRRPAND